MTVKQKKHNFFNFFLKTFFLLKIHWAITSKILLIITVTPRRRFQMNDDINVIRVFRANCREQLVVYIVPNGLNERKIWIWYKQTLLYYIKCWVIKVLSSCTRQLVAGLLDIFPIEINNSFSLVESFCIVIIWWWEEKNIQTFRELILSFRLNSREEFRKFYLNLIESHAIIIVIML